MVVLECLILMVLIVKIGLDFKRKDAIELELARLRVQIEDSTKIKEQLDRIKRDVKSPSTELSDFLADIRIHGFGVVRLDPDSLMVRSPRTVEE